MCKCAEWRCVSMRKCVCAQRAPSVPTESFPQLPPSLFWCLATHQWPVSSKNPSTEAHSASVFFFFFILSFQTTVHLNCNLPTRGSHPQCGVKRASNLTRWSFRKVRSCWYPADCRTCSFFCESRFYPRKSSLWDAITWSPYGSDAI